MTRANEHAKWEDSKAYDCLKLVTHVEAINRHHQGFPHLDVVFAGEPLSFLSLLPILNKPRPILRARWDRVLETGDYRGCQERGWIVCRIEHGTRYRERLRVTRQRSGRGE